LTVFMHKSAYVPGASCFCGDRVCSIKTNRKGVLEQARKVGVYASLWAFISLLIGAFSATYMATVGGRVRDDLPAMG